MADRVDALTISFLRRHFPGRTFTAEEARRLVPLRIALDGRRRLPAYGLPSTTASWRRRLEALEARGQVRRLGVCVRPKAPKASEQWAIAELGQEAGP